MRVLITSGGTKVKIDMVRHIANMSKGTFGSKIAESFACTCRRNGGKCDIKFLMAKDSKYPTNPWVSFLEYETFDEYEKELFFQLAEWKPDILVLAAAVSDYGVENYVDGKIRSKDELIIRLKPLPKLISKVRNWMPDGVICGFKLLVNSTDADLLNACEESLVKNNLDLVVGNDLRDIKNNDHKLFVFRKEEGNNRWTYHNGKSECLEDVVSKYCIEMYERKTNDTEK